MYVCNIDVQNDNDLYRRRRPPRRRRRPGRCGASGSVCRFFFFAKLFFLSVFDFTVMFKNMSALSFLRITCP